jgi:predicted secreted protein
MSNTHMRFLNATTVGNFLTRRWMHRMSSVGVAVRTADDIGVISICRICRAIGGAGGVLQLGIAYGVSA